MDNTSFKVLREETGQNDNFFGRFIFEPLNRGYADTLGNALRRLLLSSIHGAAVTAVKIDGILHEFSTVKGVREDIVEILMNLKHIPVKVLSEFPRTGFKIVTLDTDKLPEDFFTRDVNPGVVTAADMPKDADFEFTGDNVLCEIEKDTHLVMDLYVEEGEGYLPSERERNLAFPIETILTDAIFSPVKRVNYRTEPARVGQDLEHERLVIDIWTNGAVEPAQALKEASEIATECFKYIADNVEDAERITPEPVQMPGSEQNPPIDPTKVFLSKPIKELELSIRSENCLLRGGIKTVNDLLQYNRDELLKIRNLGRKSLDEIIEKLNAYGYALPTGKSKLIKSEELFESNENPDDLDEESDDEPENLDNSETESEFDEETQAGITPNSVIIPEGDSSQVEVPENGDEVTEDEFKKSQEKPQPEVKPAPKPRGRPRKEKPKTESEIQSEIQPEIKTEIKSESTEAEATQTEQKIIPESNSVENAASELTAIPEVEPEPAPEPVPEAKPKKSRKSKKSEPVSAPAPEPEKAPEPEIIELVPQKIAPEPEPEAKPKKSRKTKKSEPVSEPEKPKRGRGRPRKVPKEQSEQSEQSEK